MFGQIDFRYSGNLCPTKNWVSPCNTYWSEFMVSGWPGLESNFLDNSKFDYFAENFHFSSCNYGVEFWWCQKWSLVYGFHFAVFFRSRHFHVKWGYLVCKCTNIGPYSPELPSSWTRCTIDPWNQKSNPLSQSILWGPCQQTVCLHKLACLWHM